MTETEQPPSTTPTPPTESESKSSSEPKKTKIKGHWKGKNKNSQSQPNAPKQSSFKGTITEMNGHTFECHGESIKATQFHRTMEELQSYCTRIFKYGDDICYLVRHLEEFKMEDEKPADPGTNPDRTTLRIWEKEVDKFVKRRSFYKQNKSALYMVIWSQCSDAM